MCSLLVMADTATRAEAAVVKDLADVGLGEWQLDETPRVVDRRLGSSRREGPSTLRPPPFSAVH